MKLEAIGIREKNKPFRVMYAGEFKKQIDSLAPGKYRLTVERFRKNKSNAQLGYYHACVLPIFMRDLINAGWEFKTIDEVDAFAKSRFADTEIINRDTAEVVKIPALKRNMTSLEMATFTNAIRDWDAEYLGGNIPEPLEQLEIKMNDENNGVL